MKILILFAHPAFEKSIVNKHLVDTIDSIKGVTLHDLYQQYPDFDIDVTKEQKLLIEHDCIVFMYPMFWYSTPPIIKQWQDLVLRHGWAFGKAGTHLHGKIFFPIVTTGGPRDSYTVKGMHRHTIEDFLLPITTTAKTCGMTPIHPFLIQGTWAIDDKEMKSHAENLSKLLNEIVTNSITVQELLERENLNVFYNNKGAR